MRPLRYSINITLDGCCDHRVILPDRDLHHYATQLLAQADALIFGRVIYQMMEEAWRLPKPHGAIPDWMVPFAQTIHAAKKYVVSRTLDHVDWNAELLHGDLETEIRRLKEMPGQGLYVGGVQLPMALAHLGLIDEFQFLVQPRLAGRGPTLFAGLPRQIDLTLIGKTEFPSGAVALRCQPRQ